MTSESGKPAHPLVQTVLPPTPVRTPAHFCVLHTDVLKALDAYEGDTAMWVSPESDQAHEYFSFLNGAWRAMCAGK